MTDRAYQERIGGRYIRDTETGARKRVEGLSEPAPTGSAGGGGPAGQPASAESAVAGSDDRASNDKPTRKGK